MQPPLDKDAWTEGLEAVEVDTRKPDPELLGAAAIKRVVAEGPAVVHHWATWCEACSAEVSLLDTLAARADARMIAVSWDGFEGADDDTAVAQVSEAQDDFGAGWRHLVVKGKPPHFFRTMGSATSRFRHGSLAATERWFTGSKDRWPSPMLTT